MKPYFRALAVSVIISLLYQENAFAGAWMQPDGGGQIITTATYYSTDWFFNKNGGHVDQTSRYTKYSLDVYMEYGLSEAYTIGMQPTYDFVQNKGGGINARENDLADTPVFLRERIWHDDNNVFSVQQLATIPGPYDTHSQAALGYGQSDLELRGLYGHSGNIRNLPYFTDIEGAYRERFDGPANELRMDLTLGVKPQDGLMLLAQSFSIAGLGNATTHSFVPPSAPNYDLSKIQLSGVVDIPYGFSLQGGGAVDVYGRNTGGGQSLFVAVWRSF